MIFYSTNFPDSEIIPDVQKFFPRTIPAIFSSCEASRDVCFFLIQSFHPSLLSGKPATFSFYEAPEKNRA